jgi:Uma2 family endonuclease
MSPLHSHEQYGKLIGRIVETYSLAKRILLHSGGSTTFKREAKKRGLEPDECYWIQNEPAMRGRKDFDINRDPPPDLAIEVDITRSSLDRMRIYAVLGVPEVWRFNGETLGVHLRRGASGYTESEASVALPDLTPADVMRFLNLSDSMDETNLFLAILDWAREQGEAKPARPRPPKPRRPPKK